MKRFWGGLLTVALLIGVPAAYAADDWNLWQEAIIPVYQKGNYSATLIEHIRFRDDFSEIFFTQAKIKNHYVFHPNFSAALNYSYIELKGAGNHWRDEHRPELELYPKIAFGDWVFENRNRFELRLIEGSAGQEDVRYRNRLQVTYTLPFNEKRWKVFASEEAFYDIEADAWNQNRVFAGFRWTPNKTFSTALSWGIQSLKRGSDWEDRQVVYSSIKLEF